MNGIISGLYGLTIGLMVPIHSDPFTWTHLGIMILAIASFLKHLKTL